MPFQSVVNQYPSPAVEGDFASDNPRKSLLAGDSALLTSADGVYVGRFAWADDTGLVYNAKPGAGVARLGFVAREGNSAFALLATWLSGASLLMNPGQPITLHTDADVWVRCTVAAATPGLKAFASHTDGTVQPGAAGAAIAGYDETPWFFTSDAPVGSLASLSLGG